MTDPPAVTEATEPPVLEIVEDVAQGQAGHWRLRWHQPGRQPAERDLRLDLSSGSFQMLSALAEHLDFYASPDRGREDEDRMLAALGDWLSETVLGPIAGLLSQAAPGVVRLRAPDQVLAFAGLPLELARVNGCTLLDQGLLLVRERAATGPLGPPRTPGMAGAAAAPDVPVRILAVLSAPGSTSALGSGHERRELLSLAGDRVQVRVLQYGVTRTALAAAAADPAGWDVIHLSGHGAPGTFVLETPDGDPDPVGSDTLSTILAPARGRTALLTVASCSSAGLTIDRALKVLGWATPAHASTSGPPVTADPLAPPVGTLAARLGNELGCAVLAMRYAVDDRFAADFTGRVYRALVQDDASVAAAFGAAQAHTREGHSTLSPVSPVLFADAATQLYRPLRPGAHTVRAPEASPSWPRHEPVEPPPSGFVGRVGVLSRCWSLIGGSDPSGVLLLGMPGAGKTACAQEFASQFADRSTPAGAGGAGVNVAWQVAGSGSETVQSQFDDFDALAESLGPADLLVLDNAEDLVPAGEWRDPRWPSRISGLAGGKHAGPRLLVTSRVPLPNVSGLATVPIGPLSPGEAVLVAATLPHLSRLVAASLPGIPALDQHRLAARSVRVASGHPYLLRLADSQAADPDRLGRLLAAADPAWRTGTGVPSGFLHPPDSDRPYVETLGDWVRAALQQLPAADRLLAQILARVQAPDRSMYVIAQNWADIHHRIGRDEMPPMPSLDALVAAAITTGPLPRIDPSGPEPIVDLHALVAEVIRASTDPGVARAVDDELARFWVSVAAQAWEHELSDGAGDLLLRAIWSSVPYLRRLGDVETLVDLVQQGLFRDTSQRTASAILPVLQDVAPAVAGTEYEPLTAGLITRVQLILQADRRTKDVDEGGPGQLRALVDDAVQREDWAAASIHAGDLAQRLADAGYVRQALETAAEKAGYSARGQLGPWTRLADDAIVLRVQSAVRPAAEIRRRLQPLQARAAALPPIDPDSDRGSAYEVVVDWNVREGLLFLAFDVASRLEEWEAALDVLDEALASKHARGAPEHEIADTVVNRHGPLAELGRFDEARASLRWCRDAYRRAENFGEVGLVLSSLAGVEAQAGRTAEAADLERNALRLKYTYSGPSLIQISHHNLAEVLARAPENLPEALAHHAAAAMICLGAGDIDEQRRSERALARDLQRIAAAGQLAPNWWDTTDAEALAQVVDEVPGVDLLRLVAPLGEPAALLSQVSERAVAALAVAMHMLPAHLATWDPVIDAVREARRRAAEGDEDLLRDVDTVLAQEGASRDWEALVRALRSLLHGSPLPDDALDGVDAPILNRAQRVLSGERLLPENAWQAVPLRATIGSAVLLRLAPDDELASELTEGLDRLEAEPAWATTGLAIRLLTGLESFTSDETTSATTDHEGDEELELDLDAAGYAAIQLILLHSPEPDDGVLRLTREP